MAEEPARSDASISTVGSVVAEHDAGDRRHVRRISYFMLFRLGLLTFFTVLAGLSSLIAVHETDPVYEITIWSAIGLAFAVTLFFAWRLRCTYARRCRGAGMPAYQHAEPRGIV